MNETKLQVNSLPQEFISLDEAAQQLGVTTKGLRDYLKNHPDIRTKFVDKEKYNGRRRLVFKVQGLPFVAIVRNTNSKNLKIKHFEGGKEKLAEKVATRQDSELIKKLILAVDILTQKVNALESKKVHQVLPLPIAVGEPAPISHRSLINQRIRTFAQENDLEYFVPWGRLYEEMYYRYRVNIRQKSENRGIKPIDVLAEEGLLEEAWKLACKLFKLKGE